MRRIKRQPLLLQLATATLLIATPTLSQSARGDGPSAAQIFPDTTVAFLRLPDAAELGQRFNESALGLMIKDEQVQPVIQHLYGSVTPSIVEFQEQIGISLEDLNNLAVREIAVGLVSVPSGRPALVLLIQMSEPKDLDDLLERAQQSLVDGGFSVSQEKIEGVEATVYSRSTGDLRQLVQVQLEDALLVTSNLKLTGTLLSNQQGNEDEEVGPLANHEPFKAVMTRCNGGSETQLHWYVDPIGFVRAVTRGNVGAAAGLALLPAIGLDGLLAAGGTIQIGAGEFDMISHAHILLDQPRDGVLELITLQNGPIDPEPWMPADVASYATWNWDVQTTYTKLSELVDSFRGEGAVKRFLDNRVSEQIGADFEEELLAAMTGRFTLASWYERPITIESQANVVGIQLNDPSAFQATLAKVAEKFTDELSKRDFAGVTIYQIKNRSAESEAGTNDDVVLEEEDEEEAARQRRRRERRARRRRMSPVGNIAIVGDYLVMTNRERFIEKAIMTQNGTKGRLIEELDYRLIASKIKRQPGGQNACMVSFERPDEALRVGYELLHSDEVRQQISKMKQDNPFFQALDDALTNNEFPPFEVIAKYLAPGGAMLTNEESGFHYVGFGLRRMGSD